jgi:hypothetical protein
MHFSLFPQLLLSACLAAFSLTPLSACAQK